MAVDPTSPLGLDAATPGGDIDDRLSEASGVLLVAYDVAARLECPPGGLYYDSGYGGIYLPGYVGKDLTNAVRWEIEAGVIATAEQDPRVLRASVTVADERVPDQPNQTLRRLVVTLSGTTAEGPFRLVIAASEVGVELLTAEES